MEIYETIKKIVNAPSKEIADSYLLNSKLLLQNNREYYKSIVANFIRKKETIIKKENGKLIFDLNNTSDIWNIVFIGEYIKENDILYKSYNNLLLEIVEIENKLLLIKEKHNYAKSKEEHININSEYQLLNNELYVKKNELKYMEGVIETFYNTNWVKLMNSTDKIEHTKIAENLKQAINIIHKIRNSLAHDNLEIRENIEIDDENFKVSIPIEYIDGFNKGRIIAKDKDKIIVERTNIISLPLLEELNCDINQIQSFFYNIDPYFLSLLLEQYDFDINNLYNLTSVIIKNSEKTKKLLKAGISIEIIEKIPPYVIMSPLHSTDNILETIEYLSAEGLLDKIQEINQNAFHDVKFLDYYIKTGIEIDVISSFDFPAFSNPEYAKKLLDNILILKENDVDVLKLVNRFNNNRDLRTPFDKMESIIEFVNELKKHNITIDVLYDENVLKEELFNNKEIFKQIITEKSIYTPIIKPIIDYMHPINSDKSEKLCDDNCIIDELVIKGIKPAEIGYYGSNFEKLKSILIKKKLYPYGEENRKLYVALEYLRIINELDKKGHSYETVDLFNNINQLLNNEINIEIVDDLSIDAIANVKECERLLKSNVSCKDIKKLPSFAYKNIEETIILINYLNSNGISFESISNDLWKEPLNAIRLIEEIPKEKGSILKNFTELTINNVEQTSKLIKYLLDNDIDLEKVSPNFFGGSEDSVALLDYLSQNKYELKIIEKLPPCAFLRFNEMDYIYFVGTNAIGNKKYEELPTNEETYLQQTEQIIQTFIINGYTADKDLPEKVFSVPNVKRENIEYLIKLVNYEYQKLDEFPIEFYCCNYDMLDTMCKNYNYNLCKSIFGINNSKLISTLIYGNYVFSQYQKENEDASLIDLDPMAVIHAGFNTTNMYKGNTNNLENSHETYLEQFLKDDKGNLRSSDDIKKYILDKFRNSCAHFRFKHIQDELGNTVEDKIYLYDKYDDDEENNFNIILDVKDFVEITRQVEIGLCQKKNAQSVINEENRFKRS